MLDCTDGSHHRVEFEIFVNLGLLAHSSCVYKHKFVSELVVEGGDGVACCTCDRGHDVSFLSEQGVCK